MVPPVFTRGLADLKLILKFVAGACYKYYWVEGGYPLPKP